MTKILYSPGYGAGWITWASCPSVEAKKFILTYKPIIDHLESGEKFERDSWNADDDDDLHPLLRQFKQELEEKFGMGDFYVGGACQLEVENTKGRAFQVDDYDGSETVVYEEDLSWIQL